MLFSIIICTCEQRNKNRFRQIILKAHVNLKARDKTKLVERLYICDGL
jgi:hypothetical protein